MGVSAIAQRITAYVNGVHVMRVAGSTFSQGRILLFSIPMDVAQLGCTSVTSNFNNVLATAL